MKTLLKYGFLWMPWLIFGQIQTYEYWYDDDYTNKTEEQVSNLNSISLNEMLDVSSLNEGIHTYSIHFEDVNNQWSSVSTNYFYKLPLNITSQNSQINYYESWFDGNYMSLVGMNIAPQDVLVLDEPFLVNFSYVDGLHTFSIRFRDNQNLWSSVSTSFFYVLPENLSTQNLKINQYEYWFDDEFINKTSIDVTPQEIVVLDDILDVSSFQEGLHNFSIRFKDENDQWSSVSSDFFYKLPENVFTQDLKIEQYEYWLDEDYDNRVTMNIAPEAVFILDDLIDTNTLVNGIHTFNIRFKDELDKWTGVSSHFFYKNPENVTILRDVVEYQYWFDDDYDNQATVTVTPGQTYALDTFVMPESFGLGLGLHDLNIRFKDSFGQWSSIVTDEFEITILLDSNSFESALSDISVYPNPTSGSLNVNLSQYYDEVSILLSDLSGRIISQEKYKDVDEIKLNLNLPSGIYILVVEHQNQRSVHKILKR